MRQKSGPQTSTAEKTIKDIRRAALKHHSAEDKIRIVLEGLRGEDRIAAIYCCDVAVPSELASSRADRSTRLAM